MQSFIRHITGTDERIIMLARLHWIHIVAGFFWMSCCILIGAASNYFFWIYFEPYIGTFEYNVFGLHIDARAPFLFILFGLYGLAIFVSHIVKTYASEIALTNERVIYKTGLVFVEVEEIDLVEIRAEHVQHGLLGRFLNYGRLQLDSRFVGDIQLPAIKKPYKIIKAMHSARQKIADPMAGQDNKPHKTSSKNVKRSTLHARNKK